MLRLFLAAFFISVAWSAGQSATAPAPVVAWREIAPTWGGVRAGLNVVTVADKLGCSEFVKLVKDPAYAEVFHALSEDDNVTFFCPDDVAMAAFNKTVLADLRKNPWRMKRFLNLHAAPETVKVDEFSNDERLPSFTLNCKIRLNVYKVQGKTVKTVNGITIKKADNEASNGIVHVMNKVIYSPACRTATQFFGSITQLFNFTKLIDKSSHWKQQLNDVNQNFTIFAPKTIPVSIMNELESDQELADRVIGSHILPVTLFTSGMYKYQMATDVNGDTMHIYINPKIVIKSAKSNVFANLVVSDVGVANGVVHVIDKILYSSSA